MKKSVTLFKDAKEMVTRPGSNIHWIRLIIAFAGVIVLSFGFAALLSYIKSRLNIDFFRYEYLAYISVFVGSLLANMTILAPVPFAVAIMGAAAKEFNPIWVAFFAALGGTLGELSGYYAGRLGKKIAIPDSIIGFQRVENWITRYGVWAISVLAFQPIIPFDIGGLVAGVAQMPVHKFLPALFAGKFPKYILLTYAALGLVNFLPDWFS